jgi:hypothetical protein
MRPSYGRPIAFLGMLVFCVLAASPAQAFTVKGGTEAQRAYVTEVINACSLAPQSTDSELRAMGPVQVKIVDMDDVRAYSKSGVIYVDDDLLPGELLGELVTHEWAHQIWYSLGPKWWQKWAAACDPGGKADVSVWRLDVAENFAECARVALWGKEYSLRDRPCTDLGITGTAAVEAWLTLARYVNKCPFSDLGRNAMPSTEAADELAAAGGYLYAEGIVLGSPDGKFHPEASLAKQQLAVICQRAGLHCPASWQLDSGVATRGDVRATVPGLTWTGEHWSDPITRGQFARLIWRAR